MSLNLECIGVACVSERLKPVLLPLTSKVSLKVLHIRQSGSDSDTMLAGLRARPSKPTARTPPTLGVPTVGGTSASPAQRVSHKALLPEPEHTTYADYGISFVVLPSGHSGRRG